MSAGRRVKDVAWEVAAALAMAKAAAATQAGRSSALGPDPAPAGMDLCGRAVVRPCDGCGGV